MTLRYALDTNVVSEAFRPDPAPSLLKKLHAHGHECAVPVPVWHELRYGVERLPPSRRRTALERYMTEVVLASWVLLPYDKAAADWHAAERARLEQAGRTPPFVDGSIAAIARIHDLTLVTDNLDDFRGFRGLKLVNWLDAG